MMFLFKKNHGTIDKLSSDKGARLEVLDKELGSGSFANVFAGIYSSKIIDKTPVAAKRMLLDKHLNMEDEMEISILRSFDHENVLRFIDAVESKEKRVLYIVTEIVQGEDCPNGNNLARFCNRNCTMDIQEKLLIALKYCLAVEYLHLNRIVHRDIKPQNILVSQAKDTVKLCDFGLADRRETASTTSTTNNAVGTYLYMPPDVVKGKKSQKGDIWSLGMTTAYFIAGSHPFQLNNGEYPNNWQISFQLIRMASEEATVQELPGWQTVNDELRKVGSMSSFVKRMLAPNHKDRPMATDVVERFKFNMEIKDRI